MKSLGRTLIYYDWYHHKERKYGHRDAHPRNTPYEDEGRDASTSQGLPASQQKLGRRHETDSLSQSSEGTNPAGTFDLRLEASRTMIQ